MYVDASGIKTMMTIDKDKQLLIYYLLNLPSCDHIRIKGKVCHVLSEHRRGAHLPLWGIEPVASG